MDFDYWNSETFIVSVTDYVRYTEMLVNNSLNKYSFSEGSKFWVVVESMKSIVVYFEKVWNLINHS